MDRVPDWDPCAGGPDLRLEVDALRERAPAAYNDAQGWTLLRHADVLAALHDPATYSSTVSVHVAVPNGMDPPEHDAYRAVVDRSFAPEDVVAFTATANRIADVLIEGITGASPADVMATVAEPFAARVQCAYLGWSDDMVDALQRWAADSARAKAAGDRAELDRVAADFDRIISTELARAQRAEPPTTVTQRLVREHVASHPVSHDDLVSMMRNWTAGELGTIAAAIGVVVEFLGRRPDVREVLQAQPALRQRAIDEMLRLDAPLVTNRRRTTTAVTVGEHTIPADAKVTILWPAVQRDLAAFADPTEFRLDRDPSANLLYGRGPHYCPGEGLARVELGAFLDAWLARAPSYEVVEADRAPFPAGGYERLVVTWLG